MTEKPKLALRIDDIGASSKRYEIYSTKWFGLGNILFLKYLPYFKAWGPYRELTPEEWEKILELLKHYNAKLTVAITATWVDSKGKLTPFSIKFPRVLDVLTKGEQENLLEIAIHGLTHCDTRNHSYLPKFFKGNRTFHREFKPDLDPTQHFENLRQAKSILESSFKKEILIFVPPGNMFSDSTLDAAVKLGLKVVNCNTESRSFGPLTILGNEKVFAFHDKEVVELGLSWFENKIKELGRYHQLCRVSDLL